MTTLKKWKMNSAKKIKIEDDLKKNEDDQTKMKMENDLKKKWKTNQSTKINPISCDTIVNSPSFVYS